jgi:hypothetical protein
LLTQAKAIQLVDLSPDQPAVPILPPRPIRILSAIVDVPPFAPVLLGMEISNPCPDRDHFADMPLYPAIGISLSDHKIADTEMI